jgi:hypothetical protein
MGRMCNRSFINKTFGQLLASILASRMEEAYDAPSDKPTNTISSVLKLQSAQEITDAFPTTD